MVKNISLENSAPALPKKTSQTAEVFRRLCKNKAAMLGLVLL